MSAETRRKPSRKATEIWWLKLPLDYTWIICQFEKDLQVSKPMNTRPLCSEALIQNFMKDMGTLEIFYPRSQQWFSASIVAHGGNSFRL